MGVHEARRAGDIQAQRRGPCAMPRETPVRVPSTSPLLEMRSSTSAESWALEDRFNTLTMGEIRNTCASAPPVMVSTFCGRERVHPQLATIRKPRARMSMACEPSLMLTHQRKKERHARLKLPAASMGVEGMTLDQRKACLTAVLLGISPDVWGIGKWNCVEIVG